MSAFNIRLATVDDAAAIGGLIEPLAPFFLADPDDRSEAGPFFATLTPEWIAESITGGRFRYHLAEDGEVLAGLVGMRDRTHLYHLMVAEAYHRRGLGRRLWQVARSEVEAEGPVERYTVNASLFGLPFYRSLGFVATDETQTQHGLAYVPMAMTSSP